MERGVIPFGALSYIGFAGDEAGHPLVDKVIKLEEIESHLPPVREWLGVPLPRRIPRTGRGRYRGRYQAYYDDDTRELVGSLYEEDIERFSYAF